MEANARIVGRREGRRQPLHLKSLPELGDLFFWRNNLHCIYLGNNSQNENKFNLTGFKVEYTKQALLSIWWILSGPGLSSWPFLSPLCLLLIQTRLDSLLAFLFPWCLNSKPPLFAELWAECQREGGELTKKPACTCLQSLTGFMKALKGPLSLCRGQKSSCPLKLWYCGWSVHCFGLCAVPALDPSPQPSLPLWPQALTFFHG